MKKYISKFFPLLSASLIFILLFNSDPVSGQQNSGWQNLKYSIFFTHGDVQKLLSDQAKFKETMDYFAPIKIEKVYLEGIGRGDEDVDLMKKAA